jgi:signal peptidase I
LRYKKALSRTGSVLIALVFGFSLFVFITVIVNWGSGVPNFYGYSFLNVSTPSMEPAYPVNSILITKKTDMSELAVGDVISFYSEDPAIYGKPNTHRIISKGVNEAGKTYFVTKGDNNPVSDRYLVYEDKVIGRVQGSVASAGKLLGKINNRYTLFFLLIVPLGVVVFFEIRHIKKLFKAKETEIPDAGITIDDTPIDGQADTEQALLDKINKIQAEIDRLNSSADKPGGQK